MQISVEVKKVYNTIDLTEIRSALESVLLINNEDVRFHVIEEIINYLRVKLQTEEHKLKVYIINDGNEVSGFVIAQVDPSFTSYSRKCGTFGWLHANSFDTCKELITQCEKFFKENKMRRIRGNINIPKNLGGIGIQFQGFEQQRLYGVACTNPKDRTIDFLNRLGYRCESEYTCVYVTQKTWEKGKKIDKNIVFRYVTLEELENYAEDIQNLGKNSFHDILPDSSGRGRIFDFFKDFQKIPKSFYNISQDIDPKSLSTTPHFIEAWETCDLIKIEPLAPMAFDRHTNELVGILLGLPDLYQAWAGEPITRVNVDTAMVKKGYFGKGIFSALNNMGQLTANLFGIDYFEGTMIWSNNSKAVDTIFPHCKPIKKHYVLQKRIKI